MTEKPRPAETVIRYRTLSIDQIEDTIDAALSRINGRFPDSGLGRVCCELREIAGNARGFIRSLRRPIYPIRVLSWLLIVTLVVLALLPFFLFDLRTTFSNLGELVQAMEASLNEVVLVGLAVLFLATWEKRIKRQRVLKALGELRSIVHVVDMHQLTKDPKSLHDARELGENGHMVRMSRSDLAHYLDYCSEVLSLASKLAALYLEEFEDSAVIGAVNEVENLVSGLSRKIWQKIMILDREVMET